MNTSIAYFDIPGTPIIFKLRMTTIFRCTKIYIQALHILIFKGLMRPY